MQKYVNDDGKIAVLVSPGYGAGWSTWGMDAEPDFLAMDKGLVELHMSEATPDAVSKYIDETMGKETYTYTGGWSDIVIEWLEPGTKFTIEEYDGSESLRLIDDLSMTA